MAVISISPRKLKASVISSLTPDPDHPYRAIAETTYELGRQASAGVVLNSCPDAIDT
ncbi:hypothetical protein H6F90_16390 [Trichocoleus sp. FACHB-591]|uniref:hypothetical protein n=1 Tax=Trichocoleus sp. FACHB-591 TaxID=2692872 RepID=UPI001685CD38|nr:hypothetical protein [Trichocoleus sp. FACHB-591]MBD2096712.1 hypothetical protein [Trichocoleus sp. FACHB-591]